MGSSTSKFINDAGSVIGGIIAAPFKSIFGRSCEDVCEGIWDVVCFIEHICIADLMKFLLVCCLSYICLVFVYLIYKLGICQCMTKIICKTSWAACETFWLTLDYVCCFCWHKIRYTKRVYRGRRRLMHRHLSNDVELGYKRAIEAFSDDESAPNNHHASSLNRKRKSRERFRSGRIRNPSKSLRQYQSLNAKRFGSTTHRGRSVRLSKNQFSIHSIGRSQRMMRRRRKRRKHYHKQMHMSNLREIRRSNTTKFKKQRTT